MTYLMLFSTDIMKIDPMVVGILFFVLKFWDAITDILVTNIADKTQSKWGRYRPWMLMAIPLAFALVFSFWYPSFLQTEGSKILWLCISFLLIDIFESGTYLPTMVMGTTMSSDTNDRLDFATARSLGEYAAEFIVSGLCMTIVLFFGLYTDVKGWRYMAIFFAILTVITAIIGFKGTKERVISFNENEDGNNLSLREKLSVLWKNKPFFKLLVIQVTFALQWVITLILFSYFCIHNLGHEEWIPILTMIGVAAQIVTTMILPYFGRKMEKRQLIRIGCILLLIAAIILGFTNGFVSALIFQVIKGLGIGLVFTTTGAMWPEVTDYTEWKTGVAAPGIILAVSLFCFKVFSAFSSYAAGAVLSIGGYDATLATQSSFTLNAIRMGMVVSVIACIIVTMITNSSLHELSAEKLDSYRNDIKNH